MKNTLLIFGMLIFLKIGNSNAQIPYSNDFESGDFIVGGFALFSGSRIYREVHQQECFSTQLAILTV